VGISLKLFRIASVTLLVFALAGGLFLRLNWLDAQGLWHDEFYSFGIMRGFDAYLFSGSDLKDFEPPRPAGFYHEALRKDLYWENLGRNLTHEGHPPLYYLLCRIWVVSVGYEPSAIKLFSVSASLLFVVTMFFVGWRVDGRETAVACGLLASFSPFCVFFASEARSYSLALLLLSLTTLAAVSIIRSRRIQRAAGIGFCVAAIAALYTYYYLTIAVAILSFLIFVSARDTSVLRRLVYCATPFFFFVPRVPVLFAQSATHAGTHWTEGSVGGVAAIGYFLRTIMDLLSSPYESGTLAENSFILVALAAALFGFLRDEAARGTYLLLVLTGSILFFGMSVYVVDRLTDHHTIAVPRYSFALTIPLYLFLAGGLRRLGGLGKLVLALLLLLSVHASIETAKGQRAPRQMLREVGSYLSENARPEDLILITPSGPTLLGVAYYSSPDLWLAAAPRERVAEMVENAHAANSHVWLVRQRLGLAYKQLGSDALDDYLNGGTPGPEVRFSGVDVVSLPPALSDH
jgi:hypothetical protein